MAWLEEDIANLKYMLENHFPRKDICEVLGKSDGAIYNKMKQLGISGTNKFKEKNGLYLCANCKEYKSKEEYYKNKANATGIGTYCIPCTKIKFQEKKMRDKFAKINAHIEKLKEEEKLNIKSKEEVNGGPIRICTRCNISKHPDEYAWGNKYKKLHAYCKKCHIETSKISEQKRLETKGY